MDSAGGAEGAKGSKAWNPTDLTLGSIGHRSLQDIAEMEVSNVFGSFFDKLTAKNRFDQCIQFFFATIILSHAAYSMDSLGTSA